MIIVGQWDSDLVQRAKELQKWKHVERKYHLIRDIVQRRDATMTKIATADNLTDLFTKALPQKVSECYPDSLGPRCSSNEL